ncbi:[Fe-Fe] hydrogenase large subunit C-terminal domain-containing protein [Natronospora cellulosivora (SeqCode)]
MNDQEHFRNFSKQRMEIFKELVRYEWKDHLTNHDLEEIATNIVQKYNYKDEKIPFIKDHIRVAMGLDPNHSDTFKNELDILRKDHRIKSPILTKIEGVCENCGEEYQSFNCFDSCKYDAHIYQKSTGPLIIKDECLNCGRCTLNCTFGALADKIEFIPLIDILKDEGSKVFAAVAPSIAGQFGDDISMGQLRTAFKLMGFEDMVEVALFADILTIKEAYEFDQLVKSKDDFFLTSCCCPVWINMIEKKYPELFEHMSPAVSPMIASGRFLKKLYNDAKVVFISPCTAKKAEAKDTRVEDAIDFVLTYQEIKEIFDVLDIKLEELPEDDKDQASFAGRVYARTGGVSLSVKTVVNRIAPDRLINLKAKKVHGVKGCKEVLEQLKNGENIGANFIEGMGCIGGCVGGPKTNIEFEKATSIVNEYAEDSLIMTPMDNMNIIKILKESGLSDFDDIFQKEEIVELLLREKIEVVT